MTCATCGLVFAKGTGDAGGMGPSLRDHWCTGECAAMSWCGECGRFAVDREKHRPAQVTSAAKVRRVIDRAAGLVVAPWNAVGLRMATPLYAISAWLERRERTRAARELREERIRLRLSRMA